MATFWIGSATDGVPHNSSSLRMWTWTLTAWMSMWTGLRTTTFGMPRTSIVWWFRKWEFSPPITLGEFLLFYHQCLFSSHRAFCRFRWVALKERYIFSLEVICIHIRVGRGSGACRACWLALVDQAIFLALAHRIQHRVFLKMPETKYRRGCRRCSVKCVGCWASFQSRLYIFLLLLPKPLEFALGGVCLIVVFICTILS